MSNQDPFNINPELAAMRENVAKRVFRLKVVEATVQLATLVLGAVAFFALASTGVGAGLGGAALPLMLAVGTGVASFITTKARKRLEIDEEFLESRMQGRNWWSGYKQELGVPGQQVDVQAPAFHGIPAKGQQPFRE